MSDTNGKPKVAFFDFASCEGCQLTVVDSLQTHLDLLEAVEIVQFREAMTEKGEQAYRQSIKREVIHRIVSSLSEEQRRHLSDALEILWARAREELRIEKRPLFPPPL